MRIRPSFFSTPLVAAATAALVSVGGAVAGHLTGPVPSYTGCLNPSSSTLTNLRAGDSPSSACKDREVEVHLSSGDITTIVTQPSGGLQGGVAEGAATLALQDGYKLPQSCATGQVAKWDAAAGRWGCADDANAAGAGGDVTAVAAGTGLSGGGLSGDVVLSADTAYLQRRVAGACPEGQSIRAIDAAGLATCEADDDTRYAAGTGLALSAGGTPPAFSIAPEGVDTAQLNDGAVTADKLGPGAVRGGAGGAIADRSITAHDLANGAVQARSLSANAALGTGGATLTLGGTDTAASSNNPTDVFAVIANADEATHRVLLNGWATFSCSPCPTPADAPIRVGAQPQTGGATVGSRAVGLLDAATTQVTLPVTVIATAPGAAFDATTGAAGEPSLATYSLAVDASRPFASGAVTITVTAQLVAVDLGRS